jgi:oligopeptide/dipeptide ABC transporter ATP-binding protein
MSSSCRSPTRRSAPRYLGQIVELADSMELCAKPLHPYTQALFTAALPADSDERHERLTITGEVPSALDPPTGYLFDPCCPHAMAQCSVDAPLRKGSLPGTTSPAICIKAMAEMAPRRAWL